MSLVVKFFFEILISKGAWDLPKEHMAAIVPHLGSDPSPLYIPWPIELRPNKGEEVNISTLPEPFDLLKAGETKYRRSEKGYEAHMKVGFSDGSISLGTLRKLADEGCLFEDKMSITNVIYYAKLGFLKSE